MLDIKTTVQFREFQTNEVQTKLNWVDRIEPKNLDIKSVVTIKNSHELSLTIQPQDHVQHEWLEIYLEPQAKLSLTISQDTTSQSAFFIRLFQSESSQSDVLFRNKTISHMVIQVDLNEAAATTKIRGLLEANQSQELTIDTIVTHHAPATESNQLIKTILYDDSTTEFNGSVLIKPSASKAVAHQVNRNLLLSDTAKALTRPHLRIQTNNVECSHGATVGQLNDDELFYLQSRGLMHDQAKQLLIEGFAQLDFTN